MQRLWAAAEVGKAAAAAPLAPALPSPAAAERLSLKLAYSALQPLPAAASPAIPAHGKRVLGGGTVQASACFGYSRVLACTAMQD